MYDISIVPILSTTCVPNQKLSKVVESTTLPLPDI